MKRIGMLFTVSLLFAASTCFAQMYTVTDLGYSYPKAISSTGAVAGYSNFAGTEHAFLYSNGTTIDIGTLEGIGSSEGLGINAAGQVVGVSSGVLESHAFLYSNGKMIDLGPGGATAINEVGQITGSSNGHAFLYSNGTMIDIGTLGGTSSGGGGINNAGQVTGSSQIAGDVSGRPFLYSSGSMIDLGTLGGRAGGGSAINDAGQVVGFSYIGDDTDTGSPAHAFLYSDGTMVDLGTFQGQGALESAALGINNFGEVVGFSEPPYGGHAFLYASGTSEMKDLNTLLPDTSGWELTAATAINDNGQITGLGVLNGQYDRGYLLNPIYTAAVKQPINTDGTSVFSAKRGVVPVKFVVIQYGSQPSCTLPANITVVRTGNGTVAAVDESTYSMSADSGSNFRIDSTTCQYVYNLAASALGVGTYRVDISINGITVGHAVFALK